MPVIPRTPFSQSRQFNFSTTGTPQVRHFYKKDIYDKFLNMYINSDRKIRSVLINRITEYIQHPVYTHLLNTIDEENIIHVIGYLRSQHSVELYNILELICNSPLPTHDDFFKEILHFQM
jgi:hypothetical protein